MRNAPGPAVVVRKPFTLPARRGTAIRGEVLPRSDAARTETRRLFDHVTRLASRRYEAHRPVRRLSDFGPMAVDVLA